MDVVIEMLTSFFECDKAFISYMRSVYLQKNKAVFKLTELPAERFAESLGLPGAPKIKFLNKMATKLKKDSQTVSQTRPHEEKEDEEATEGTESEEIDDYDGDQSQSSSKEEMDVGPIGTDASFKPLKVLSTCLRKVQAYS